MRFITISNPEPLVFVLGTFKLESGLTSSSKTNLLKNQNKKYKFTYGTPT